MIKGFEDIRSLSCTDALYGIDDKSAANREEVRVQLRQIGQTEDALMCWTARVGGSPYFLPTDIGYTFGGTSHNVGYNDYVVTKGDSGLLYGHGQVMVLIAFFFLRATACSFQDCLEGGKSERCEHVQNGSVHSAPVIS